jgi:hypothetical protein
VTRNFSSIRVHGQPSELAPASTSCIVMASTTRPPVTWPVTSSTLPSAVDSNPPSSASCIRQHHHSSTHHGIMLLGFGFVRHHEVYTDMNTFASNSNNISWSATATRALNVVTIVCSIAHLVLFIAMPELFDAQFARVGFCATDQGWLHTMEYVASVCTCTRMHLVSGLVGPAGLLLLCLSKRHRNICNE